MSHGAGKTAGVYGTNVGDTWLGSDSDVGRMLLEHDGLTLIFEVMVKDGRVQECMYSTKNPELIAEATKGHELYVAARAAMQ